MRCLDISVTVISFDSAAARATSVAGTHEELPPGRSDAVDAPRDSAGYAAGLRQPFTAAAMPAKPATSGNRIWMMK